MTTPLLITNRVWVPTRRVPPALIDAYQYQTVQRVQNEEGFWEEQEVTIDVVAESPDGKYLGFPRGNLDKVITHIPDARITDKRAVAPLGVALELGDHVKSDERWPEQERLLAQWLSCGGGCIKAPAASGKSVIGVAAVCALGLRTLLLFEQRDFLKQWHSEFYAHTNLSELEAVAGEPLAGKFTGKRLYPITFATFDKMNTKASRRFIKAHGQDYFGAVICDESLPYEAEVLTTTGYRPIGEIVADPHPVRVVCFDGDQFTSRDVTKKWESTPKSPLVEVTHAQGSFRCTANHLVLTQRGYVPAAFLDAGFDSVVCITDERTEKSADRWVQLRGRPLSKIAEVQPSPLSDQPQPGPVRTGPSEVRNPERLVRDTPKTLQKPRTRRDALEILNPIEGRIGPLLGAVLHRSGQEVEARNSGGVLGAPNAGMVADGRWQPQRRRCAGFSYRELHARRPDASGSMDEPEGLFNFSLQGTNLLGALPVGWGLRDAIRGCSPFYDPLFAIQDPTYIRESPYPEEETLLDLPRAPASSDQAGWDSLFGQVQTRSEDTKGTGNVSRPRFRDSRGGHASRVLGVREVETPAKIYDLSVAEHANFVVRGVVLHNSHHVASRTRRDVVLMFSSLVLAGVTATPHRKDKLEGIYFDVLGPITAAGGAEQMDPLVRLHHTNFEVVPNKYRADFAQFGIFLNQIAASKERNERIVRLVTREVYEGRCVLIVSDRNAHCERLAKLLRTRLGRERIALVLGETKDRKAIYDAVNNGMYDVLIASKVIDEGVNVTRLDSLHLATPLASAARLEQRVGRVRRPRPGKPRPRVHDYIDVGHGAITGSAYARQKVYHAIGATVQDTRSKMVVQPLPKFGRKRRRR